MKKMTRMLTISIVLVMILGAIPVSAKTKTATQQPVVEGAGIEVSEDEWNRAEILILNAQHRGIIDSGISPMEFNPSGEIYMPELALWVQRAITGKGESGLKAIKWLKKTYGYAFPTEMEVCYNNFFAMITLVLEDGKVSMQWKECMDNLKMETKILYPALSKYGRKMSRIEALYLVAVLLVPDMPHYCLEF